MVNGFQNCFKIHADRWMCDYKITPGVEEGVKVCLCMVLFIDQVLLGRSLDQPQT